MRQAYGDLIAATLVKYATLGAPAGTRDQCATQALAAMSRATLRRLHIKTFAK
jgi:hypothetical protein